MSADLLPTENPGPHYQGDARDLLCLDWDLLIAHPPCTYLTNAGVRNLWSVPSRNGKLPEVHGAARWQAMGGAALFFNDFWSAPVPRVCVENPIPHRYARVLIGPYTQIVQPWMFGHGETKATCLWLRGLPPLTPTNIVPGREHRLHRLPPSPDRAKKRALTFQGLADAMAAQWG